MANSHGDARNEHRRGKDSYRFTESCIIPSPRMVTRNTDLIGEMTVLLKILIPLERQRARATLICVPWGPKSLSRYTHAAVKRSTEAINNEFIRGDKVVWLHDASRAYISLIRPASNKAPLTPLRHFSRKRSRVLNYKVTPVAESQIGRSRHVFLALPYDLPLLSCHLFDINSYKLYRSSFSRGWEATRVDRPAGSLVRSFIHREARGWLVDTSVFRHLWRIDRRKDSRERGTRIKRGLTGRK